MDKIEDAFDTFYNEFKDWTKKQILHRTFDIILKDTEEIGEKDKEIERLKAREQECLDAYRRARQDVTEIESKYVYIKYVIDELEKYVKGRIDELKKQEKELNIKLTSELNEVYTFYGKIIELKEGNNE